MRKDRTIVKYRDEPNAKVGNVIFTCINSIFWGVLTFVFFSQSVCAQGNLNAEIRNKFHNQAIEMWDAYYHDYFKGEIARRLFDEKDVYVLYDIQIGGLQSFVELTRREKDVKQIGELTELLLPIFSELKPLSAADTSKGWVCMGGKICTDYKLIGKEVPLCSIQYLGLIGALSTAIVENVSSAERTASEKAFLSQSFNTMAVQLNRWLTGGYFSYVKRRLDAAPANVKDRNSGLYFTDKDLWNLTVLSDLSELISSDIKPSGRDGESALEMLLDKREGIAGIFDLFLKRTSLLKSDDHLLADLDRGFWRFHFDNRYAGYEGETAPVEWITNGEGGTEMVVSVPWDSSYIAVNSGWDISHARRIVPALETFVRNRENIRKIWKYDNPEFDPVFLREAFANQIVEKIWNNDLDDPEFTNFWSGDNGWYRVAYANNTGRQFAGYPPYGLSASMHRGGYPVWGAFNPVLAEIFKSIYRRMNKDEFDGETSSQRLERLRNIGLSFLSDIVELYTDPN